MKNALKKVKLLLNKPQASDDVLNIYIDRAVSDIKGYCNLDRLPKSLECSVIELAVMYFNRQGIEGATSYHEGGVAYGFAVGLPENIKSRLQKYVRGKLC